MSHKVLIAVLCLSLVAFGQKGARNSSPTTSAANPVQAGLTTTQPIAVGNGLGWTAGTVGFNGEGPAGGVLLNTPIASFDSPQPTAGISNAGRAGISDSSPLNTGLQSSLNGSTLVYTNLPPEVSATEVPATEAPAPESPATTAVSPTARTNDYGPSFFSNEAGGNAVSGASLAEIAARYQKALAAQNLRTYTNRDVRAPANIADTENVLLARNTPPSSPQSSANTPSGKQGMPSASSPAGTSAPPTSGEQQTHNNSQSQQLPASSSILPLLGLLGVMSVGLGLCVRALGRRKTA